MEAASIIGLNVHRGTKPEFTKHIISLAESNVSGYICVANVHMLVEARRCESFRVIYKNAALCVPDGQPLVWLQKLSTPESQRYCGRDLILEACREAAAKNINIGFYGSNKSTLNSAVRELRTAYPGLPITFCEEAPMLPPIPELDEPLARRVRDAKVQILFVALGCPKQEYWMADNTRPSGALTIGIGAAIDFLAGTKPVAPAFLQRAGLEWLHRLVNEPRRLFLRYLFTNTAFFTYCLRGATKTWLCNIFKLGENKRTR